MAPHRMTWDFVAGLFVGRGWVTVHRHRGRRGTYAMLGVSMTTPTILQDVKDFIGGGRVNGPYARSGGGVVEPGDYRDRYVLSITRREDIDRFLLQVYDRLGPELREEILIAMGKDTRGPWEMPA